MKTGNGKNTKGNTQLANSQLVKCGCFLVSMFPCLWKHIKETVHVSIIIIINIYLLYGETGNKIHNILAVSYLGVSKVFPCFHAIGNGLFMN